MTDELPAERHAREMEAAEQHTSELLHQLVDAQEQSEGYELALYRIAFMDGSDCAFTETLRKIARDALGISKGHKP